MDCWINKVKIIPDQYNDDKRALDQYQVTAQVTAQVAEFCIEAKSAKEIIAEIGLKHWKTFQMNYLDPLLESSLLERTIPDKNLGAVNKNTD